MGAGEADAKLEQAAAEFVRKHFAARSAPAEISVALVRQHYADIVHYFGKYLQRHVIIKEYRRFVRRWPERWYNLRLDSVNVQCSEGSSVCTVGVIADWVAISRARAKKSVGHSLWTIGLRKNAAGFVITSVNGDVLQRRITGLAE